MPSTNPVGSLRSRVPGAPPAQGVLATFAAMALVAGTWIAFGSAPARAVVGDQTTLAHNPSVALVSTGLASPQEALCTGALISSNQIMTAGRCVDMGMKYGYLGTANALHPADKFTINSTRRWAAATDLAVMTFSPPVQDITPVIVDTNPAFAPGTRLQIFGYGLSGTPGCGPAACSWDGLLRMWNGQVEPAAACTGQLIQGNVCMTPTTDTVANGCYGDSGGPVYNLDTGRVVGVYSGRLDPTGGCASHQKDAFTSTFGATDFLFG